jgi:hypothetical protein
MYLSSLICFNITITYIYCAAVKDIQEQGADDYKCTWI